MILAPYNYQILFYKIRSLISKLKKKNGKLKIAQNPGIPAVVLEVSD
jgi:hypothetical protein